MGNTGTNYIQEKLGNPFYATDRNDNSEAAQILSQFKLVSTYQDQLFQRCSVIEHKQTQQLIIAKQMNCSSEQEMNRLVAQFERRKELLTSENLVRLRYIIKKKTDGLFSDQFKIILFFDYILASAQVEYNNRCQKKNPFTHQQINIIICGAIKGYSSLEGNKIPNDKVRLKNIYFGLKDKSTNVKIIDSKLFPTDNNIISVKNRNQDINDIFLSPQQLKGVINSQKSGVFSLGICMMQLCLLEPCRVLYNYQNCSVNYKQIETRLNIIKNKYPLSVFYLIRQMLQRNQDSRPSFTKLAESLPQNIKNLPTTINLSIVGKSTDHVIKQSKFKTKILPPIGYSKSIAPIPIDPSQRNMHQTTLASEYRPQVNSSELYTNGNMFTGQKKDGLRHGKGKYLYADGSYYYGDWFKGKMEGLGKLYDQDGNLQYEGQWRNDHYDGKGTLYGLSDVDWIKYVGDFKAGKKEGFGQMYYKDGNKYKGQFRSDYPWGKGRLFLKNGEVKNGLWQRGEFKGEN